MALTSRPGNLSIVYRIVELNLRNRMLASSRRGLLHSQERTFIGEGGGRQRRKNPVAVPTAEPNLVAHCDDRRGRRRTIMLAPSQIVQEPSARCVAPNRLIRTAIDGGISRISSQSVSDRRRLKIERCLAIGKAICCPGPTTATSRPWSSVIRVT